MGAKTIVERALEQGNGVLRLAPCWVPRVFCVPGRRIRLHPDDYYAMGADRGGIDERWLSSTTKADNGPKTLADEGLSYIVMEDGAQTERALLVEAILEAGKEIIGERLMKKYRQWPVYSKFFDNKGPLPHHVHLMEKHARNVSRSDKPEAYYFPPQMNNYFGDFPHTYFGLEPGTTKEQVMECLANFNKGDNKITNLSRAYRLEPGTGWDVPPGLLHAPGTLCTYEPQKASDVFAMFQSVTGDQVVPRELLLKDIPSPKHNNMKYLVSLLDWELNVDPNFVQNRFMRPKPVRPVHQMEADGYVEHWICYRSSALSAKELTVLPGRSAEIADAASYGLIVVQGCGALGEWEIESPTLIRYGQLTNDEFFVTEEAAKGGVVVSNLSQTEPLVMLKHFGPGNPDLKL